MVSMYSDVTVIEENGRNPFQTFQPLLHANLEVFAKSPEKPGDWDLKPGDFQNMCQIKKNKKIF